MATDSLNPAADSVNSKDKPRISVFDVTEDFFDSCRLLSPSATSLAVFGSESEVSSAHKPEKLDEVEQESSNDDFILRRWTCNTCRTEFDSLQDQRSHFKSDIHRLNIKLSVAGKAIVKEEDVDELTSNSFQDFDVSSISGSEDESDIIPLSHGDMQRGRGDGVNKKKLYVRLQTEERISIWKSLIMEETESVSYENDKGDIDDGGGRLQESEVIQRLRSLTQETRDNKHLRVVLLASGGHFAGSVFDGKSVVAHKTFHRYVVRAKAGKKQSSKDGSGKSIHSAGASLRRYNELALKKNIQELLASWKPFFDAASCVFVHAPSNSRQLLFNAGKSLNCAIRDIPFTVRRPTFKESQRLYNQLTQLAYEAEETAAPQDGIISNGNSCTHKEDPVESIKHEEPNKASFSKNKSEEPDVTDVTDENEVVFGSTPLHEATKSSDCAKILELLEQGMDPCAKDERGKTPYMLANEKEVRNTFRRFMAANLDRWDWHAAKVPSALTKEMEESQTTKQAEKDAKRRARAKELKKLRKAREKKAQAEAAQSQDASKDKQPQLSKEEELKRAMAAEREKRAAAAERRIAAVNIQSSENSTTETATATSSSQHKTGVAGDIICSCCNVSLAGKVPFHRYNYKYCSTSCMHVHREFLEDGG